MNMMISTRDWIVVMATGAGILAGAVLVALQIYALL